MRRAPQNSPRRLVQPGRLVRPGRPPRGARGRWPALAWLALGAILLILIGSLVLWRGLAPSASQLSPTPRRTTQTTDATRVETGATATALAATVTPEPTIGRPSPVLSSQPIAFDVAALQKLALELINRDRSANRLQAIGWDSTAAAVGQAHAEEMANLGYLSHWNTDGYGPDHRYSRAGALDAVMENVYMLQTRRSNGSGASISDWAKVIEEAQVNLMHSEGHRANILAPEHTHVGVGIAYSSTTGDVRIVQEFVNRYVRIASFPKRARPGDLLVLRGELLPGSVSPLVNLAFEPVPVPMTLEQLNVIRPYESPAKTVAVIPVKLLETSNFVAEIKLDSGGPVGFYHVRVWVDHPQLDKVQAADLVIEVR